MGPEPPRRKRTVIPIAVYIGDIVFSGRANTKGPSFQSAPSSPYNQDSNKCPLVETETPEPKPSSAELISTSDDQVNDSGQPLKRIQLFGEPSHRPIANSRSIILDLEECGRCIRKVIRQESADINRGYADMSRHPKNTNVDHESRCRANEFPDKNPDEHAIPDEFVPKERLDIENTEPELDF